MKDVVNKRSFPRRKLDLAFDLVINGEVVPAVVTDYSPSGMAILIKGRSDLNAQVLDLRVGDLSLNATGKVVWKREMFSGIKVGAVRMGPLEGMLHHYAFSDLLLGIQRTRKTGILHIETAQSLKKIYFRDGEVVFSSDQEQEQLGAMLLASGRISARQYQSVQSLALETGKSEGAVLVEMRYLTPQKLVQAVHLSVESVIMNVSTIEDATFLFREEALPRSEIVMLKLNTNDLLYRASKKAERIDTFRNRYLHNHTTVSLSSETRGILDRLVLEPQDREILSLINGKTSLQEILSASALNEEDTLRSIHALYSAQLLEVMAERAPEEKPQERDAAPEGRTVDPLLYGKIDKLYREHKTLGYQGVLGLLPGATSAEIKHAYHAMAKEYHPDRYLLAPSEELREKLNVIFAYINEAYRELSRSGVVVQPQPQASASPVRSPGTNSKTMAQGKYRQGRQSLSDQDDENAMTYFGQAVYLDDSVPDYHYYYGIALLRNKKIKEAEASIRRALNLSPYNADYFAELGHIYLKLGFMTRAKNTFDKALKIDPSHARAAEGMKNIQALQAG